MSPRVNSFGVSTRGGALLRSSSALVRGVSQPALSGLLPLLLTSP